MVMSHLFVCFVSEQTFLYAFTNITQMFFQLKII